MPLTFFLRSIGRGIARRGLVAPRGCTGRLDTLTSFDLRFSVYTHGQITLF